MVIRFLSIFMKAIEQSSMNWAMPHAASLSHLEHVSEAEHFGLALGIPQAHPIC